MMNGFEIGVKYKPFAKYIKNGEYPRRLGMQPTNAFIQMLPKVEYFIVTEKKQYNDYGSNFVRSMTVGFGGGVETEYTFGFSVDDDFKPILADHKREHFRVVRQPKPKCAAEETARSVRERMEQHEARKMKLFDSINDLIKYLDGGLTVHVGDGQYHVIRSLSQLNTVLRDKMIQKRDKFRIEAQKNSEQADAIDKILENI